VSQAGVFRVGSLSLLQVMVLTHELTPGKELSTYLFHPVVPWLVFGRSARAVPEVRIERAVHSWWQDGPANFCNFGVWLWWVSGSFIQTMCVSFFCWCRVSPVLVSFGVQSERITERVLNTTWAGKGCSRQPRVCFGRWPSEV